MLSNSNNNRVLKCLSESPEKQTDTTTFGLKKTSIMGSSSSTSLNSNNYKFSNSDLYDYTNETYKKPSDHVQNDEVFDQVVKIDEQFDGILHHDQNNSNQTLKILNALRKNRQLCDLILQLDDDTRDIYCHQIILACNSKFFMEIFTNYELEQASNTLSDSTESLKSDVNLTENEQKLQQIRKRSLQTIVNKNLNSTQRQLVFCLSDYLKHFLKDTNHHHYAKLNSAINHNSPYHHHYNPKNKNVDPVSGTNDEKTHQFNLNMDYEALKVCIDYMYTSTLKVPCHLIPHVYTLAYHLSFENIVNACAQHLTKNLCVDNCLSIRSFALDEQLIQESTQCIEKNIEYILELKKKSGSLSSLSSLDLKSQDVNKENNYQSSINLANKEFNNLPRIVIELVGIKPNKAKLPDNIVALTHLCMNWLVDELCEKSDHDLNYLCDNMSMLYMDSKDHHLHDCCDMDSSDMNFTDHINDYQKLHSVTNNGTLSPPIQKPTFQKIPNDTQSTNSSSTRLKTFKITDQELNAIGTATPIKFKVLHDNEIICTHQVSEHSFITICTLTGKLVTLCVHLIPTQENSSDSDSKPELNSDSKTSLNNDYDSHSSLEHQQINLNRGLSNGVEFERLAKMKIARCSHGVIENENKLYIVGGYERGECLNICEVYDPQTNKLEEISPMQHRRGRAAVTYLEKTKSIYVMGGSDGHEDLNSIETYNFAKKEWKLTKFDFELGFTNLAAIGCDKFIYLVGLKGDSTASRSRTCCLRYEPETNEFNRIAELNFGRSQSALVWTNLPSKSGSNFILYVFGGNDSMRCLASCEMYNVLEDKWTAIASMQESRRGAGAAVHVKSDMIYVVGGTNGTQSLKSVEIYDIKNKRWTTGPSLNIARTNVTVEFIGDILFAIGGFDGKSFLKTIEYLNCNNLNNGWSMYHKQNDFEFLRKGTTN
ncbi:unnamed protein product [Brachionus calyciflorus]|uniref:BTB domain-containing protein n=1 Tax=Brachionus calyciflorus TaxID=104777 RepID=A0A813M3F9_9BILA|nr:unnamed protein product [Brachionus calyciflorus]